MRSWLPFLLCLASGSVFATKPSIDPQCVAGLYRLSYANDYRCTRCPKNVWKLLKTMQGAGADMREFKAVFFKSPIVPQRYRDAQTMDGWEWHVVVLHDGKILDQDFSAVAGEPVPSIASVDNYVRQNFGSIHNVREVPVRVVDADYYLAYLGASRSQERFNQTSQVLGADHMMNDDLGNFGRDFTMEGFVRTYGETIESRR